MKKVLIVSYSFPPINNVTASQYGEFVSFMPKFGWEPFVLTTKSQGELPVKMPERNIVRIGEHYHSNKKFAPQKHYIKIPKLLIPLYLLYRKLGIEIRSIDRFILSWKKDVLKNTELIKKINPDVIVAVTPPVVSSWTGRALSQKINKPWVSDLRDSCSLYNHSKIPFIKFLDEKIDKFLMRTSAAIITVGPSLASLMRDFYEKPVGVVYNGFNSEIAREVKKDELNTENKRINRNKTIYSAGVFYSHRLESVKLLIDWLAVNKKNNLQFIIRSKGPVEMNEKILNYAKEKNVKVELLEPASPDVVNREKQNSDILVLFEGMKRLTPTSYRAMPGKLFEYLPFKAPILAISQKNSDIEKVLKETGRGYLVSDAKELDSTMKNILEGNAFIPDWEKVESYSRESQCKILCNLLDQII